MKKHTSPYYILLGAYVLLIVVIIFGSCTMRKTPPTCCGIYFTSIDSIGPCPQPPFAGHIDSLGRIIIDAADTNETTIIDAGPMTITGIGTLSAPYVLIDTCEIGCYNDWCCVCNMSVYDKRHQAHTQPLIPCH